MSITASNLLSSLAVSLEELANAIFANDDDHFCPPPAVLAGLAHVS
ncbi:MAG: hypothetical protein IT168_12925 [Bryobacterales bacterium]|nr:hypothetical protein [Bryobacterales bacterium]